LLLLKHQQRGIALGIVIGVRHHRGGNQPVAVLDKRVAKITQLRFLSETHYLQPRTGIGGRFMRLVRAALAAEARPIITHTDDANQPRTGSRNETNINKFLDKLANPYKYDIDLIYQRYTNQVMPMRNKA